ncbi:unnamed protein product, partial [Laminaria digitata]
MSQQQQPATPGPPPAPAAAPAVLFMGSPPGTMSSPQPLTTTSSSAAAAALPGAASPAPPGGPAAAALPAPPPAPAAAAAAAAASAPPNGLATQYGMVMWPSLPGMQQAAVGVAPPSAAAMSGVAAMARGGVGVDVTGGRGGILTAVGAPPMMPAGGVTSPSSPRVDGDWGGGGSASNARRPKPRVSGGGKKEEPKSPGTPGDRDTMIVLRSACDACHRMKRKCDGLQPCNRCRRRSRSCGYSYKQKSGPPKGSKRKLIAADEDLLENRQPRPKLLPLAMWPNESEESRAVAVAAVAAAGDPAGASSALTGSAATSPGANGINRLLAVGGHSQPPRLPGISIPPEGSASNGAGAAAAAAAVAAASSSSSSSSKPGASPPVAARSPSPPNPGASSMRASPKSAARDGSAGKSKAKANVRPIADLVLPSGAAVLSLEARAGAYRRAQEAAAAGMAAARAFVEGDFPTENNGEFAAAKGNAPGTGGPGAGQPNHNKQGIMGRINATAASPGTPLASPSSASAASDGVASPPASAIASRELPAPMSVSSVGASPSGTPP